VNRLIERCAMLDIHKSQITACVRVPDDEGGRRQEIREFRRHHLGLLTLADWLRSYAVTVVGMESTGVYWRPVFYLVAHPEKGLLAYEMGLPTIVQYWRSFDHLESFASDKDDPHLNAWREYWRRVGRSDRTGIWHETYLVRAGQYEAIYGNMPPHRLGKAGRLIPASEASTARSRLGATALDV
jgi:Domain of unknown function (DUF4188)